MPLVRRPSRTVVAWLAAAAIAVVAGTVVLGALRPWAPAPVAEAASGEVAAIEPAVIALPAHPRLLVFGDSWTYGSAATPRELGYAFRTGRLLGAETTVDGVRGSGYLKPGYDGGSFGERIAALDADLDPDLVIVQGSLNDRGMAPAGYREAVAAAWDALAATYPDAHVVILGPAPSVLPVQPELTRIDDDLAALAAERGWWYVSPLAEGWITGANYPAFIDASVTGRHHPSVAGHAYLAERLAADLGRITDLVADGPRD